MRAAVVPLEIARASADVFKVARDLAGQVHGPMRLDVSAASNLAQAAARSSLDLAQGRVSMAQSADRRELETEIMRVRSVLGA